MPDQQRQPHPQQPRPGDGRRPLVVPREIPRTQATPQVPIASIEPPENLLPAKSSSLAPTPAQAPLFRVPESPRSATGDSSHKAAKIAIPRLKRSIDVASDDPARLGGRHRVNHACEPCRHRKTKCSGERPVCRHCQDFQIACFYADGKRDRVRKQFGTMTEKVAEYERLLKELIPRVGDTEAQLIKASLEKESQYDVDDTATDLTADSGTNPALDVNGELSESGAESEASAGAGSTGALDRTDEDFTREQARSTGFLGKNSEVTWLHRLKEETKHGDRPSEGQGDDVPRPFESSSRRLVAVPGDARNPRAQGDDIFSINDYSYHLDDMSISTFDAVDPYEMPTPEIANLLFNAYVDRVHPSFPIVGRLNLTSQFRKFISGTVQRPPEKWLAILNLIFAIGAKYSHLIKAEWRGDERDHLIFFTRARLLSTNAETIFQHPDLQLIQILGLMSFYLLCTSQVNRAWILNGLAIREASSLGMNVRNDSTSLKNSLKEIRYRVWWALYTLEHRLCNMTGRVNCILDEHCTTPLPVPLEEEYFETDEGQRLLSKERQQGDRLPSSNSQTPSGLGSTPSTDRSRSQTKFDSSRSPSIPTPLGDMEWAKDVPPNTSLYFLHLVQLARLTQNIFHRLYNPASISGTWSRIQTKIKDLDEQLEHWYSKLPPPFAFRRKQRERGSYEARLSLGFFYYSTKMTIHRPCLCRLDRKIPNQSAKSLDFNRNSAATCVESAMEMLGLIPDEPNAVGLMRIGPWWCILHWLVQATAVLMLEISFRANHMPEETESILDASRKGIRWLHALAEDNTAARRAWSICFPLLQEAVKRVGRSVDDLPQHLPGRLPFPHQDPGTFDFTNPDTYADALYASGANVPTTFTMADIPTSQTFATYDPLMQYDQYFPPEFQMEQPIPFQHNPDLDIDFMSNPYHEGQDPTQPGDDDQGGSHLN